MRRNSRRYFCNFYASLKLLPKFLKIAPRRAEQFCKQMVGARFLTAGPGIKSQTREDGARAQPRRRRAGAEGGAGNLGAPARGRRRPHRDTAAAARRADAARQAPRTSLLRRLERPRRNGGRSPRARAVSASTPETVPGRGTGLFGERLIARWGRGRELRKAKASAALPAVRRGGKRTARRGSNPKLLPEARGAGGAGRVPCAGSEGRGQDRAGSGAKAPRSCGSQGRVLRGGLGGGPGPAGGRAE